MYHLDIPKTRQYDTGKIEVIARSSAGEALATTELKVIPRHDDYRGVLKNAPRRKYILSETQISIKSLQINSLQIKKEMKNVTLILLLCTNTPYPQCFAHCTSLL